MTERVGTCKRWLGTQAKRSVPQSLDCAAVRPWRLALIAAATLSGCTVGPSFKPPAPVDQAGFWPTKTANPAGLASVTVPDPVDPRWWTLFGDTELTSLEQRLGSGNLDVGIYAQRLSQSRAQLSVARTDLLPTLDANGSYTRERPSAKGVVSVFSGGSSGGSFASQGSSANGASGTQGGIPTAIGGEAIQPFNLFQYGFDASWELDIWGHARRQVEAAVAGVQGAEDAARNTLVSSEAELARDYIQLRGLQQRIALTRADLDAFQATLRLTRERSRAGLGTTLDVTNATAELATTQSALPQLLAQQVQMLNALCLLLGEMPGALDTELTGASVIPPVPPVVPVGLPSELARRRPDIRAAEAQLHVATAQIGVAIADFYPKVTLSGSIGIQALLAKDLGNWSARQYGAGPTISLPIFEGGRLRATLELRKAQQREAAISYRRTVLQAFGDVSNALTGYDQEQARRTQLQAAVQANQESVSLALQRYRQGLGSFIDVLDAQRQQFETEQQLADSTATVSTDLVALFKALGGGWDNHPPEQHLAAR